MMLGQNNKKYKQGPVSLGSSFKGMLNFKLKASNLDKEFFVYYEGPVANGMLDGQGEIWLFSTDEGMYFWEGEFIDGFLVSNRCTATNFPYGANLFGDLNLELKKRFIDKEGIFSIGFNHRTEFIIPLLTRRESIKQKAPVLLKAYEHLRSVVVDYLVIPSTEFDVEAPATPKSLPRDIQTPERAVSYAKQRNRLPSVTSI